MRNIIEGAKRFYHSVSHTESSNPNPFLGKFEKEVASKVNSWPLKGTTGVLQVAHHVDMEPWEVQRVYEWTRQNCPALFTIQRIGRKYNYSFTDSSTYGNFALMCKLFKEQTNANPFKSKSEILRTVTKSNADPETQVKIQLPTTLATSSPKKYTRSYLRATKRTVFPSTSARPPIDALVENIPSSPLDLQTRIPKIKPLETEEASLWDKERVGEFLADVPGGVDDFSFDKLKTPPWLVNLTMFIWSAHKHNLRKFDPVSDLPSFNGFRDQLKLCIDYLDKYPRIKNMAQLFRAVENEVRKNPNRYWGREDQ